MEDGEVGNIHRLGIMFARSMIILVIGVSWWVLAPWIFLVFLPSFAYYNSRIVASSTDIYQVYQFWQVVPEVIIFMFGPFWAGGIFEMIFHRIPLKKVF